MSIKAKLSAAISGIVAVILALNVAINYISSKSSQEAALEDQMHAIAKQLAVTIESMKSLEQSLDQELAESLRMAAIAVKQQLDPDIANVTNEQLEALAKQLDLSDITLWERIDGEIVSTRSSNPNELHMNSSTWDYWNTAFHQLFDRQEVTVEEGQRLQDYWSGPVNFAVSNPNDINKWGYYYDGTTNYMINTIIEVGTKVHYDYVNATNAIIAKLKANQPDMLEITGFDPKYFGEQQIIKMKGGVPVHNLDVRGIVFGEYRYRNEQEDNKLVRQAIMRGKPVTSYAEAGGKRVMRTFIPVQSVKPFVIGLAFDAKALQKPIQKQLILHSIISLSLVLITMAASYIIAGYMMRSLNQILYKVNAIAAGNFQAVISIRNKDELGTLASRVNTMGQNLHDYTNRLKQTASELQRTKQHLESFFSQTSDAIHTVDLEGRITQVNKAFETMFGWTEDEVLGRPLPNIPEELEKEQSELIVMVLQGESVNDYETVRYTKTGEAIDVSITVSAIRDEDGAIAAIASITRNITSRKQTEEMIRRSEKLSVVGQLAAGVAHEVRNPLTTLRGFVQLHKQTGSLSPQYLDLMLRELDQINMIVSEFLVLAKPQANRLEQLDVENLVRDLLVLLEPEAKMYGTELVWRKTADVIPPVRGVGSQLKQVFLNVIKNGMEAMPDGGELAVEIDSPGPNSIIIRIIDQGCGISPEDLKRLGEPFFSRKDDGNGLGIMVSQQIVDNHKGSIAFNSTQGQGTCVEIVLPVCPDA